MNNSYALITGASSGIGAEIAKKLAKKGYNLVLTARRTELLENLANEIKQKHNINVDLISKDLSKYQKFWDSIHLLLDSTCCMETSCSKSWANCS